MRVVRPAAVEVDREPVERPQPQVHLPVERDEQVVLVLVGAQPCAGWSSGCAEHDPSPVSVYVPWPSTGTA